MNAIVLNYKLLTEELVGGKFAKQAVMKAANIPVPNFFCLSKSFYDSIFESLRSTITNLLNTVDFNSQKSIQTTAKAIQELFYNFTFSREQERQILHGFDRLFAADTLVSVRASIVGHKKAESEDSINNPFAGMSESFLYVPRDRILDRIKRCWASGFSPESLLYRHSQGMDAIGFSVAVGIQQMVMGDRSFVMFTCNPKTAAKDVIVIAGYGIGEGIVQEKVAVDHYFIGQKSDEIQRVIAEKRDKFTIDPVKGYGLERALVPSELQNTSCLQDSELHCLKAYSQQIEKLFGTPQDIEGTLTADGKFYFLQSRPIALEYQRQQVWSNANITESFPGVTTTLTYSFARYFYRVIFYDLYRRLGVSSKTLIRNFEPLDKMIGFLGGRIYYCLNSFYLLHQQSPLFPLFREHWENTIGLGSSYQTHSSKSLKEFWSKIKSQVLFWSYAVYTFINYLDCDRQIANFHRWWENLMASFRELNFDREDPVSAIAQFNYLWSEVGENWGVTLTNDAYLIPLYGWVEKLFSKWHLSDSNPSLLSDLLCGDERLLSVEILLSMVKLAEEVRNNPDLLAKFSTLDEDTLWQHHCDRKLPKDFSEAVDKHLYLFGDRGLQELKLEVPSTRDNPQMLMRSIKQFAQQSTTVSSLRKHETDVRIAADRELAEKLRTQPIKHWILRFLLSRLRKLISYRENSRYCRSELFGIGKRIFRSLAIYLVKQGVLDRQDDIYHLTKEEIFGYIDGTGVTENLAALVALRHQEYEQNCLQELRENITTIGPVRANDLFANQSDCSQDRQLKGLGSSAGKVRGIAKVVIDPTTVSNIPDNTILIARETDPGWLFLMLAAKGIVVERGSMLSHTAITGRKFGIPTVVALPHATTRIPDGALIEIDGSTGEVKLIETIERS
jgi:pyruvate,water dikinase